MFAAREPGDALAGFPQLHVEPLGHRDARALLESVLPARLDERVLERIVAETGGNPLALLELPRGLTPAQLAGGFGLPAALPLSAGIEQSFTRRLARLPRDARRLLLLAAAEPLGDPALVWRAAQQLGIPESAARTAESEGLLTLDGAVAFRHPLVRSAVYGAAAPNERREAHRALAEATDPQIDPDRRAWHRAQAASVPDEELAGELERSAARAQARGGFAAAAAFLERAATLTPDPARRAQRALVAAQTKFRGRRARRRARSARVDRGRRARRTRSRAGRPAARTDRVRLNARQRCARAAARRPLAGSRRSSPTLACETYLEALSAAMFAGRLAAPGASALDVALAAKAAPHPPVARRSRLVARRTRDALQRRLRGGRSDPATGARVRSTAATCPRASSCAGSGSRPSRPSTCGTTRAGRRSRSATSRSPGRPARSASSRSRLSQRIYAHLFAGELSTAAVARR